MPKVPSQPEEQFDEAKKLWDLEKLYKAMGDEDGKPLSHVQKRKLRALLEARNTKESASLLGISANALQQDFGDFYRCIEKVTLQPEKTVTGRNITKVLDESGFKIQSSNIKSDSNFVGRDEEMAYIRKQTDAGVRCLQILSRGGTGKTELAKNYLKQVFGSYIELNIAKEKQNIVSVASWVEETLRNLKEEPGREFSISLGRLKRKLQQERIGVLIDNLEPALDRNGQFLPEHRDYFELLRVLSDRTLRSTTLITSREPLNENLDIQNLILGGLKLNVWQQFFKERGIDSDTPILAEVHKAFDGNALAMKVLCEPIRESYEGNIEAYWKDRKTKSGLMVEMAVENLIREQFDRLRDTCPEAYKLLYRMGCFRYQDVPTIPKEGLFSLLWDVPQEQHVRAVYSIKSRFLIEFDKGEYFLHPVIREEAISRLRTSGEWEEVNRKAAEFWTESVNTVRSVENAQTAFEAYHHYVTINDSEGAVLVLFKRRKNEWSHINESLGGSFYRLGLLQQLISAINQIKDKISNLYYISEIYLLLGYMYNLIGNINQGIKYHQESAKAANRLLYSVPQKIEEDNTSHARIIDISIGSFLNIGLCKLDVWEIEGAWKDFEQLLQISSKYNSQRLLASSYFCLALVKSYLGFNEEADELATKAYNQLFIEGLDGIDQWDKGYGLLFLAQTYKNLGKFDNSFEMLSKAVLFAEDSKYTQVKAKALTGLAELYRLQHDFEAALSHHLESIDLLDKIGARCDLAEAYFQLGLTYQAMSEIEQSLKCRDRAIQLFTEIEAPKQVDRVNQAFEQGAKQ